jgi:hypothetical protein
MKKEYEEKLVKGSKAAFDELITNVETLVNPNTPTLTASDRKQYGRGGGNDNKLMVAEIALLAKTQPQLNSNMINWTSFTTSNSASATIGEWLNRLNSVVYKLESAKMVLDYNSYTDAIDQYAHLQYLSRNNVQGASEACKQVKPHFKKAKPDKDKPTK